MPHTGSGGDSQVIYNLLQSIDASHFSFHILDSQKGELHTEFCRVASVSTFPLDESPLFRRIIRRISIPLYKVLKRAYCKRVLHRFAPDIVYINTVNENEFNQAVVSAKCKLITHIHEIDFVVTQRISEKWIEKLLNKTDIIISPAHAATMFYQDVYDINISKVQLLHETVSFSRLLNQSNTSFRKTLDISQDAIIVGGSGSIIYRKGIDTFVNACKIVLDNCHNPDKKIVFVWQGGDPETFQKQMFFKSLISNLIRLKIESNFYFLPYSANMSSFFAEIDVFALPSRSEAFPLVVLEALLFEKPVVAMDVGGVREVIDSETGYLVKDRTPEGLADGILHFINNPEMGKTAGKNGKKRVLEKFEAEVQSKKWVEILNSL